MNTLRTRHPRNTYLLRTPNTRRAFQALRGSNLAADAVALEDSEAGALVAYFKSGEARQAYTAANN